VGSAQSVIPFTKVYAGGNDFVVLNGTRKKVVVTPRIAKQLCHRRRGVGGDQLLLITGGKKTDYRLSIFNADGSVAETCGNGLAAAALVLREEGLYKGNLVSFETLGGIKIVKAVGKNFKVDMADPVMKGKEIPVTLSGRVVNRPIKVDNKNLRITCLSLGNPHCVIFVEDVENFPVGQIGPAVEALSIFPNKTNVEFVQPLSKELIKMRVWERGVGETDGCGSGSCAAAVASVLNGFTGRKVDVEQRGGRLTVEWDQKTSHVFLTTFASVVFKGEARLQ